MNNVHHTNTDRYLECQCIGAKHAKPQHFELHRNRLSSALEMDNYSTMYTIELYTVAFASLMFANTSPNVCILYI